MTTPRKSIYQGKIVDLGLDTVSLPPHPPFELEIVRHPGGAGVLAVNEQQQVCLIYQFRHAVGGWIWEVPAGKIDPGEAPRHTAERELQEEAGLNADDWCDLGSMYSTPGFCSEVVYLYLARQLQSIPLSHEPLEFIEIHWVDYAEALRWVHQDKIRDAKTVIALLRAQPYLVAAAQ